MEHTIEIREPNTHVLSLSGELDASQALALRELLSEELKESSVVIDMAGVPFIDSSGIGVLVAAHRMADKGGLSFAIANPCDAVSKVLALTRTDRVLLLHDDLSSAIATTTSADEEQGGPS